MIGSLKIKLAKKLTSLVDYYLKKQEYEYLNAMPFKKRGNTLNILKDFSIKNPQYIEIGENFNCGARFRLDAITIYNGITFNPKLTIGNNVTINNDVHIGCIDEVTIGDGCLLASKIFIADHSHGEATLNDIQLPPSERNLYSKGPVIIEKNVWIGQGACILPNIHIGENSIIGANAVVTKSIPKNSVAVGNPARIIKQIC